MRVAGVVRGRRGLVVAALACVVAAALGLLAAGRAWVSYTVAQPALGPLRHAASGHTVAAAVTPLALVVLAGVVALPATRRVGRRLAGAVLALAGAGLVAEALLVVAGPGGSVAADAARVAGDTGARPHEVAVAWWPWLVVVAGLIALAAGVLTLAFSRDWPSMGRRYESGRGPRSKAASEVSMWESLDEGHDPTI